MTANTANYGGKRSVTIVIPKGTWIPAHLYLLIYNAVNERKTRGNYAQSR